MASAPHATQPVRPASVDETMITATLDDRPTQFIQLTLN
jgi:hypothetical protein